MRRLAVVPQNENVLMKELGSDYSRWPKNCLIQYPHEFESQIDIVKQALSVAESNPNYARQLIG